MSQAEPITASSTTTTRARRHVRVPADFPVTLRWPGLRLADKALDLSEGGVGVATTEPLQPDTLVSLRLELPHLTLPVDVLGRVMWSGPGTMGIRFETADTQLFDTLLRMRQDIERI